MQRFYAVFDITCDLDDTEIAAEARRRAAEAGCRPSGPVQIGDATTGELGVDDVSFTVARVEAVFPAPIHEDYRANGQILFSGPPG